MAGRIGYFLIGGAAVVGGMFYQGDISINGDEVDREVARAVSKVEDVQVDRSIDRIVDEIVESEVGQDGEPVVTDPAAKRAMSEAIAELARAEGSLITIKLDDGIPSAVVKQAEERRNAARQAVERLATDIKAESRVNRDALRQNIRDEVREGVRDAVRS